MEFRDVYIHVSKKRNVNFSQCFNTYLSLECDFKFSNSATQCSYFLPVLVGFLSYTFFIGHVSKKRKVNSVSILTCLSCVISSSVTLRRSALRAHARGLL